MENKISEIQFSENNDKLKGTNVWIIVSKGQLEAQMNQMES